MKRMKAVTIVVCCLFLLAASAVSSEGQTNRIRIGNPSVYAYNVYGNILPDFIAPEIKCGDLRIVISDSKSHEILGYQYPTAIPNKSYCTYRVKVPAGKPVELYVEWALAKNSDPFKLYSVPINWLNPITVKAGEVVQRDFKLKVKTLP